jgi:DNA-binding NtrC family response regulator
MRPVVYPVSWTSRWDSANSRAGKPPEEGKDMQAPNEMLRGRRIMIVEDEMLVAMELETLLMEQGCAVVGPASSANRALALLDQELPDAAILDVNLNGHTAMPVVAALNAQGVPFLLATGYGNSLQPELRNAPRVDKPVDHDQLVRVLVRLLDG